MFVYPNPYQVKHRHQNGNLHQRQFENPSKGDWVQLVNEDLEKLNITSNHDEIKRMKKEDFKLYIKQKIRNHAFDYLLNKKGDHSKMDNISYKSFELQIYLKSQFLHPKEARDLFKWRTRMQPFKANFSKQYKDTLCVFKCGHEDSQKNILICQKIRQI